MSLLVLKKKDILVSEFWIGDNFAIWHPRVMKVLKDQTKIRGKKRGSVRQMTEVVH